MRYVYDFDEGSADDKDRLGGKGANLAEMVALGLPVPPGFVVSAEACRAWLADGGGLPEGLAEEIGEHLARLEEAMGRRLGDADDPLLVSVRSGAPVSMPGMMDTVLNLGLSDAAVEGLAQQSGDERFAVDAYRRFVQMFGEIVLGVDAERFERAQEELLADRDADDPGGLAADDLRTLVDRFKEIVAEHAGRDLPQDPWEQLELAVEAVFGSWDSDRARRYRSLEGIPDDLGTAVTVQAMVFGNLGDDSATGVAFTRDPNTGEPRPYGDWLRNAQGEDVVAGTRVTEDIDDLAEALSEAHDELLEVLRRLDRHYADLNDVEFTIERGKLWILQTRIGKRSARAALRIATDLVDEGLIDEAEAVRRVTPEQLDQLLHPQFDPAAEYEVLTEGLAASPGAACGRACFEADDAQARAASGEQVVLVRPQTSPEDLHGMLAAQGVLTSRGGLVSHAAIVARSIGKPAVVGAAGVEVDPEAAEFRVGDVTVADGEVVSISGTTGEVVVGEVAVVAPEPDETFHRLLGWADRHRRLGVRANADTGEDAARARELGAEGIGLCRTEHMFLGERLELVRRAILSTDEGDQREALEALRAQQREDFEALLTEMDGVPVTVRLLDPPLHEFLPELADLLVAEAGGDLDDGGRALLDAVRDWHEDNPMLGARGVRLGIVKPELYRMQVRALMEAAARRRRQGGDPRVEVMVPLVSAAGELEVVADLVREAARDALGDTALDWHLGVMIETPRAAVTAAAIAEHASFFSFGTNDLTQMTFGFSRDDVAARVIRPYLDRGVLDDDPFVTLDIEGVGFLLRHAVEEGRGARDDLELGVCGEHGADPRSVAFCDEVGLDYVSCSAYRVPVARLAAAHAALDGAR